jgi:hypothetical protein
VDKLARIKSHALKKLTASKEDYWSYLDEAPATESFGFCRWRDFGDEVWDGETNWLRGEVSDARLLALADPDAELSEREATIWRRNHTGPPTRLGPAVRQGDRRLRHLHRRPITLLRDAPLRGRSSSAKRLSAASR